MAEEPKKKKARTKKVCSPLDALVDEDFEEAVDDKAEVSEARLRELRSRLLGEEKVTKHKKLGEILSARSAEIGERPTKKKNEEKGLVKALKSVLNEGRQEIVCEVIPPGG